MQLAQGYPGWLFSQETQRGFDLATFGSVARYLTQQAIQPAVNAEGLPKQEGFCLLKTRTIGTGKPSLFHQGEAEPGSSYREGHVSFPFIYLKV